MWQFGGTTNAIQPSNKYCGRVLDQDYCYFDFGSVTPITPTPEPTPVADTVAQPTVKKGSTGANAKLLQHNLNKFGYGLAEDGDFGTKSDIALRGWQLATGLSPDGIYGNASYEKMKSFY